MGVTLENAPLIELIAELRWELPKSAMSGAQPAAIPFPLLTGDVTPYEEFYMRFGGVAHGLGFTAIERLVPPNLPAIAYGPVFRFRPPPEKGTKVLYQIGAGIFSANAVPPYKSWRDFSPVVRDGVRALLKARSETSPFTGVSIRYIDAFGPDLTGGQSAADFIQKLGFRVGLPDALVKRSAPKQPHKPNLQLQIPLERGMIMNVGIGEGIANKQLAILMDTTIAAKAPIDAKEDAVMDVLDTAQKIIEETFMEMTRPIRDLMKPVQAA